MFKNYYPRYFEEKAKNLATKQDIGEITHIVEGIKNSLTRETELLKSQLALNNQNKFSIKSAERDALFTLNSKYSTWIYSIMKFSFSSYSEDNYKELDDVSKNFTEKQYEVEIGRAHLLLFMHDQKLLEVMKELGVAILNIEGLVVDNISRMKYLYVKHDIDIQFKVSKPEDQLQLKRRLYEEQKEVIEIFGKERVELFKKVHFKHVEFVKLLKERIDEIIKEQEG